MPRSNITNSSDYTRSERGQIIVFLAIKIVVILLVLWAIIELIKFIAPIIGTVDTEKILIVLGAALISILLPKLLKLIESFLSKLVNYIQGYVQSKVVEFSPRLVYIKEKIFQFLYGPKWYKSDNAIEPGLIEVSLAVTAVLVALPSSEIPIIKTLRLISETISIVVSIGMLNGYARSRGSNTHILINPFENGPIFFLGWSILFALIFLGLLF